MDSWNQPRSVLSPIVIGYHDPHPDYSGLLDAFNRAASGVPSVEVFRNVKVSWRESKRVRHAREVRSVPGVDGQYRRRARCIDRASSEDLADAVNRWTWEVGFTVYNDGVLAPAVAPGLTPVVLEVSRFRLNGGAVRGAAQLALFRSLFVQGLRELDPALVVMGGQRDWDESMWTFAGAAG